MLQTIIASLMRHTDLMDKIKTQTKVIYHDSFGDDFKIITSGIENRDRMVKAATELQAKIVKDVIDYKKSVSKLNVDQMDQLINIWSADIQKIISTLGRMDEEITNVLKFQKEKTVKQIAELYQEKDKVKRYNLSTVR